MKDVRFMGSSLDDIKNFPAGARRDAAFEKKTRKTSKADIALARARYKALALERKRK